MGEVSCPVDSHSLMASSSYENPSAATCGSFIISCTQIYTDLIYQIQWIYGLIETLLLLIFPNIHHTKPPNLTLIIIIIIIKFQLWFFILCQLSSLFYFKDKTWIQYSYALDLTQCKHMITYKHVITCVRIISGSIH